MVQLSEGFFLYCRLSFASKAEITVTRGKILASLKQAKIITVKPGVAGTYLAMKPEDITLQTL
ncbi:Rrf2 family transcriptional regulator [Clostridiales Family XIII bacterium RF-744-FAT-WT-3]|uniref:Rrf2 family transcriptional regulator n=1 Tax=Baileyella intestinalis TaxID=2606709 RepID=A0A6A8M9D6_9FIRM|nr:Rrf2 family transcriptional regulator [Baileyella intestinalis]